MSNFTPRVPFEVEFDGDLVTMELIRLKRGMLVQLAPYLNGVVEDDGEVAMSFADQAQFSVVMAKILPECVRQFDGLKDIDGNHIPLETAIDEEYFQPLIGQIMGKLFQTCRPTEEERKNSPTKPVDSSKSESCDGTS